MSRKKTKRVSITRETDDLLHDVVHTEPGPFRTAKAVRAEPEGETMDPKRMEDEKFFAARNLLLELPGDSTAYDHQRRLSANLARRLVLVEAERARASEARLERENEALRAELKWVRQNAESAVEKLNLALRTEDTAKKRSMSEPVCADCGHDYFDHANGTRACDHRDHGNAFECGCMEWNPAAATEDGT
jgi:hypothetical protein